MVGQLCGGWALNAFTVEDKSIHTVDSFNLFGCWLLAKTAYMIADFGHGPCGHYADGVA